MDWYGTVCVLNEETVDKRVFAPNARLKWEFPIPVRAYRSSWDTTFHPYEGTLIVGRCLGVRLEKRYRFKGFLELFVDDIPELAIGPWYPAIELEMGFTANTQKDPLLVFTGGAIRSMFLTRTPIWSNSESIGEDP